MAHFICLVTYTQQGLAQLGATTKRAKAFKERAEQLGVKVHTTYWTLGRYDMVHTMEAPDEKTVASLAFSLAALGNVRTHTMAAFDVDEMQEEILPKVQTPYDLLRVDEGTKAPE
jgi:uncharacterized protein with GYD domain